MENNHCQPQHPTSTCLFPGKTAITFGVFDLLHFGHFELFRHIKELVGVTGRLVVAVQEDAIVTKYKPQTKLVYDWQKRAGMISTLRTVDKVVPYTDIDVSIKNIGFEVWAIGEDQTHAGFQRAIQWCVENGKQVVRMSRTRGISSTVIRGGGGGHLIDYLLLAA